MLAREAPVSAVSLAAKKAETSRQAMTMETVIQSKLFHPDRVQLFASLALRKSRTNAGSTSFAITARPMASSRMKVSLPRLTFLSCAISAISASASVKPFLVKACDILQMGRQTDRSKVTFDARGVCLRDHAELCGKFRRQHHADRDALAVEQAVGEAGCRLQRMAKGVTEIEQRALAGFALVARHDRGLGAAGGRDRVLARSPAGKIPA